MKDLYPYIKSQEDLISVIKSEYKIQTGEVIPPLFLDKLLKYRRETILEAFSKGQTVKLGRLGKFKIPPKAKDKKDIMNKLGDDYTSKKFREELNNRFQKGELHSQQERNKNNSFKVAK